MSMKRLVLEASELDESLMDDAPAAMILTLDKAAQDRIQDTRKTVQEKGYTEIVLPGDDFQVDIMGEREDNPVSIIEIHVDRSSVFIGGLLEHSHFQTAPADFPGLDEFMKSDETLYVKAGLTR